MNSSELTHAPPRRRSGANINAPSPSPPETPSNTDPSTSFPPHNATSRASRRPPPPPPPAAPPALPPFSSARPTGAAASAPTPVQGTTIYVFDPEDRFQKVQRRSLDRRPAEAIAAAQAGRMKYQAGVKTVKRQTQATVATCPPRMKSKDNRGKLQLQRRYHRRQLGLPPVDKQEHAMRAASCVS